MAFPVVQATNESSTVTAGTSHVVSLPAFTGGDSANDVGKILLVMMNKGVAVATIDALAGWNELADENTANGMYVAWRKVDGTEGATTTFTSSGATRSAEIVYLISGAVDPAVTAPTISTVATGTSTAPESSTGTAAASRNSDYLFVSVFGMAGEEADDDTWVNTAPAGYTGLLQKACGIAGATLGGLVGAAWRTKNTTTDDPAAFNVDASAAWRGFTVTINAETVASPTVPVDDKFLILGVGGMRKMERPVGGTVTEEAASANVPQGGAAAAGASPAAAAATAQGGALGAGPDQTARATVPQGGATAGGATPVPSATVAQGGATAAGAAPGALVSVGQGGADAAGVAPGESTSTSETPTPGGAAAAGTGHNGAG